MIGRPSLVRLRQIGHTEKYIHFSKFFCSETNMEGKPLSREALKALDDELKAREKNEADVVRDVHDRLGFNKTCFIHECAKAAAAFRYAEMRIRVAPNWEGVVKREVYKWLREQGLCIDDETYCTCMIRFWDIADERYAYITVRFKQPQDTTSDGTTAVKTEQQSPLQPPGDVQEQQAQVEEEGTQAHAE
jgi:hypothetical protein